MIVSALAAVWVAAFRLCPCCSCQPSAVGQVLLAIVAGDKFILQTLHFFLDRVFWEVGISFCCFFEFVLSFCYYYNFFFFLLQILYIFMKLFLFDTTKIWDRHLGGTLLFFSTNPALFFHFSVIQHYPYSFISYLSVNWMYLVSTGKYLRKFKKKKISMRIVWHTTAYSFGIINPFLYNVLSYIYKKLVIM